MFSLIANREKSKPCTVCKEEKLLADILSVCNECIKGETEKTKKHIINAHRTSRERLNLPAVPPQAEKISCNLCNHNCGIKENETSFCGLRYNKDGKYISMPSKEIGILDYYLQRKEKNLVITIFRFSFMVVLLIVSSVKIRIIRT
jgi:hypothetical protein